MSTPRVVFPVDTAAVAREMGAAARGGWRVRAQGASLGLGRAAEGAEGEAAPKSASDVDIVLDMTSANRVLQHAGGDLVLRVQAGTRLAEIQRVVEEAGQQLSLDPYRFGVESPPARTDGNTSPDQVSPTIGGLIATAAAGPSRQLYGGVRDLLIGITVVRADGVVTRSGGNVVKNVAGYDLGKLYTGSFGTLGVITEAVFRLHPVSAERRWVRSTLDATRDPQRFADVMTSIRSTQAMPTAIEIAASAGPGMPPEESTSDTASFPAADRYELVIQLDGTTGVTAQRAEVLRQHLAAAVPTEVLECPPPWWGLFPFTRNDLAVRVGMPPGELPWFLRRARELAERTATAVRMTGSAGVGVLHIGLAARAGAWEFLARLGELTQHAVVTQCPPDWRAQLNPWRERDAGIAALTRRIKAEFDPEQRLVGRSVGWEAAR